MCGFIGSITSNLVDKNKLSFCNKLIECRGPDVKNYYSESIQGNYIAGYFNRLSIVDLSELANQPMISNDGNYILFFNGEIYNHLELRKFLSKKNYIFKTSHSDTETLLNTLIYYKKEAPNYLRGQFSFVFIDKLNNLVYLSRDRVGQKPLYYTSDNQNLYFSSNLIALSKLTNKNDTSSTSIIEYLNYGKVLNENTIFSGIYEVLPGEILVFNLNNKFSKNSYIYWDLKNSLNNLKFNEEEFYYLLEESVKLRTNSDVPYATFLSGGLDSTTIVKSQMKLEKSVNTFSVYMESSNYDESQYCEEVATAYKTNHNEVYINSFLNIKDIEGILKSLDQPLADPSYIPTYVISKEIRKHYKMAISGDGGDELLGGYLRVQNSLLPDFTTGFAETIFNLYPPSFGTGNTVMSKSKNFSSRYNSFLSDYKLLQLLNLDKLNIKINQFENQTVEDNYKNTMLNEYNFFLSQLMMVKIDRASMANSIEVRSPFVDHKLIEYIFSHSYEYFSRSSPKKLLRQYLQNDFDEKFINRKKQGFSFDLETFIYANQNYFFSSTLVALERLNISSDKLSKLFKIKTRTNANRIWKLHVLGFYLSNNS